MLNIDFSNKSFTLFLQTLNLVAIFDCFAKELAKLLKMARLNKFWLLKMFEKGSVGEFLSSFKKEVLFEVKSLCERLNFIVKLRLNIFYFLNQLSLKR